MGEFSGLLITGDFNYGDIEWGESLQDSLFSNCIKHKEFLGNVEESGVFQNVKCKTFQTSDGNLANTLDLIFADSENRIDVVETSPPLGGLLIKAHLILSWFYNLRYLSGINPKFKKSKLLYKKEDYKKCSEFLDGHDWEKNFAHKNVHEC